MPPSIVLEVLRILKGEVDLREETRVAEQVRLAGEVDQFQTVATQLHATQYQLQNRTEMVIEKLNQLQIDEAKDYGQPLQQLEIARTAMQDATKLLGYPVTGPQTIAAETEAIEALLITKRGQSGGGGGGGSAPGGGRGEGEADEPSALAGIGDDLITEQRDVAQATGTTQAKIPAEFRSGLDAYFSAIDEGS